MSYQHDWKGKTKLLFKDVLSGALVLSNSSCIMFICDIRKIEEIALDYIIFQKATSVWNVPNN